MPTMVCEHHQHPRNDLPISENQFVRELEYALERAGIEGAPKVSFPEHLRKRHDGDPRAYAEVSPDDLDFRFSPQVLYLPRPHRLGLICHEIGHVLDPSATENGADRAAEKAMRVEIVYDPRWPGKGLQALARGW